MSTRKKRLRLISFSGKVGDVKVQALLNTLHHSLAEVEAKPLVSGVTLTEMLAKNRGRDTHETK